MRGLSWWEFHCAIAGHALANGAGDSAAADPADLDRVARLADAMPATLTD